MELASVADQIPGKKVVIFYGTNVNSRFDGLYANSSTPFKKVLGDTLGSNYSLIKMPTAVTPASSHGIIIVNMDQVKLHYTALPKLMDQGINAEKMYAWFNFLMGSMMLEVLADDAVIRQPLTFSA
jgi:hypothetical protein